MEKENIWKIVVGLLVVALLFGQGGEKEFSVTSLNEETEQVVTLNPPRIQESFSTTGAKQASWFSFVSCSDNDDGKDYFTLGSVTVKLVDWEGGQTWGKYDVVSATQTFADYCEDSSSIVEFYCEGSAGRIATATVADPWECKDGKFSPKPTCEDTDGGKDYYTKGTTSIGDSSYTDVCDGEVNGNPAVKEYSCRDAETIVSTRTSRGGYDCQDGRLIVIECSNPTAEDGGFTCIDGDIKVCENSQWVKDSDCEDWEGKVAQCTVSQSPISISASSASSSCKDEADPDPVCGWGSWSTCSGGQQTRSCNPSSSCSNSDCVGSSTRTCGSGDQWCWDSGRPDLACTQCDNGGESTQGACEDIRQEQIASLCSSKDSYPSSFCVGALGTEDQRLFKCTSSTSLVSEACGGNDCGYNSVEGQITCDARDTIWCKNPETGTCTELQSGSTCVNKYRVQSSCENACIYSSVCDETDTCSNTRTTEGSWCAQEKACEAGLCVVGTATSGGPDEETKEPIDWEKYVPWIAGFVLLIVGVKLMGKK